MSHEYHPQKGTKFETLADIRTWSWDEPSGLASHPAYQFLISEDDKNYSFSVFPGCTNEEDWKRTLENLGVRWEECLMAGKFGLSLGDGKRNINFSSRPLSLNELNTLHIVPQSSRLSQEDTNRILNRFELSIFQEYNRRYPSLKWTSRNDFY